MVPSQWFPVILQILQFLPAGMREEAFAKHAAEIIKRKAEHAAAVARLQREVDYSARTGQ